MTEPNPREVYHSASPSVHVQSILYCLDAQNIERALSHLDSAARRAKDIKVSIAYGDCSPKPVLDAAQLHALRGKYPSIASIDYTFFDRNLGSAAGHNTLFATADADFVMILNPDVLVSPIIFGEMLRVLDDPGVGIVEARQLPIEHPKCFDLATGETSWASTACILTRHGLMKELNGFDAETFFLYCDDVDFSWRARLAGYKVIYQSSATVFHDKRVGRSGEWLPSTAEAYFSAEAGLLLPYKYSRPDLTEEYLAYFRASGEDALVRAAAAVEARRAEGRLPTPIDPSHGVAQFVAGAYARHRYVTR